MSDSRVILGLDIGARRIGVARGDTEVKLASPLDAVFNDDEVLENLIKVVDNTDADLIVVGLPRDNRGGETFQSKFSRDFAHDLQQALINADYDVEFAFQDESLTSIEAEENLRKRKKFDPKMLRDGTIDSEAAVIILQDFLEEKASGQA
ncbi:Holliday junction resolvase RuvX [Candidatus Saccharibacteria bacterium]|nr:Holliday junction resolvase RuvX [Candidatus Saccharibacteria bacterium]